MNKPVRIFSRISSDSNDWLDRRAEETALTKSALINIAIESYIKEVEVVRGIPKLIQELEKQGIDYKQILNEGIGG